uniref:Uncharacterized protein n=1 Tax=Encephalitozoon cuniculi TaxID=6035 RepID=M1K528_ENCCN|nr:hypothetical protein ECU01_0900 [Encephalitozoon cuniculi]
MEGLLFLIRQMYGGTFKLLQSDQRSMNVLGIRISARLAVCLAGGMLEIAVAEKPKESAAVGSKYEISKEPKIINYYLSDDDARALINWCFGVADNLAESYDEINVAVGIIKGSRDKLSEPVRIVGDVFTKFFGDVTEVDLEFFRDLFKLVLVKLINTPDIISEVSSSVSQK